MKLLPLLHPPRTRRGPWKGPPNPRLPILLAAKQQACWDSKIYLRINLTPNPRHLKKRCYDDEGRGDCRRRSRVIYEEYSFSNTLNPVLLKADREEILCLTMAIMEMIIPIRLRVGGQCCQWSG